MTTPDGAANGAGFNGGGDSGQGESSGINPAWNEVLSYIPEDAHSKVLPHLQNWDKNFSNKLQEVHSTYAPYKQFQEAGIDAGQMQVALGVLRAIQEDPETVYKQLAATYNFGAEQEQGEPDSNLPPGFDNMPPEFMNQFQQLQQGYDTLAQIILGQQQQQTEAQQQAQEDAALDQEINGLKQKYGDFDERFVLAQMMAGASGEEAIQAYNGLVEQVMQNNNRPRPPKLLGSGSAVPGSNGVDPRKLDSKGTKDLVQQMLAAAAQQNQ